eukprot:Gregarina_sp_Poly_1__10697@NODE_80_length_15637_cov_125_963134_g68_i0_p6_GENE_NODE_80_length_15637_cov_125_963134_g68_i0NODE_80_length_15637_cov_125_963134_g68_i0_p6_ORF_typecomplete_len343_score36_11Phage_G/PF02306_15/0_053Alpha_GJ/PF03229_13/4_3e03Alpha_GJ/PF03229_13/0_28Sensor/PF13796_6/0_04Sensor/PF13796_6/1_2e04_NODE_80_length_15637_cov_125_963134_g68_i054296457
MSCSIDRMPEPRATAADSAMAREFLVAMMTVPLVFLLATVVALFAFPLDTLIIALFVPVANALSDEGAETHSLGFEHLQFTDTPPLPSATLLVVDTIEANHISFVSTLQSNQAEDQSFLQTNSVDQNDAQLAQTVDSQGKDILSLMTTDFLAAVQDYSVSYKDPESSSPTEFAMKVPELLPLGNELNSVMNGGESNPGAIEVLKSAILKNIEAELKPQEPDDAPGIHLNNIQHDTDLRSANSIANADEISHDSPQADAEITSKTVLGSLGVMALIAMGIVSFRHVYALRRHPYDEFAERRGLMRLTGWHFGARQDRAGFSSFPPEWNILGRSRGGAGYMPVS